MDGLKVLLADENKGFGGAERHVLSLAAALGKKRVLDSIACRKNSWLAENAGNLPLHLVGFRNEIDMLSVYSLYRHIKATEIQVIHCIGHRDLVAAALARNLPGSHPAVLVKAEHSYPDKNLSPLFLWAYNQCDAVVAVSQALLNEFQRAVKPKREVRFEVIPNGIEIPSKIQAPPPWGDRPIQVGVLSPLRPGKGHSDFLKAAAKVAASASNHAFQFSVAGDGELRQSLEEEAQALSLPVRFLGHIDDPNAYLESLDLSVVPSHRETFSLVTLESLVGGRPVVVASNEGASELCRSRDSATLYPPGEVDSLAAAILAFAEQWQTRRELALNEAEVFRQEFSAERMAQRYIKLYQELLA